MKQSEVDDELRMFIEAYPEVGTYTGTFVRLKVPNGSSLICISEKTSREELRAGLKEAVAWLKRPLVADCDPTEDSRLFPVRSCVKCGKEYNTGVCITCEGGVIPSGDIRNRGPSWLQNRTCIKCGEKYNGAIATSSGIDSHMCSKCATGRALYGLPEDEPK